METKVTNRASIAIDRKIYTRDQLVTLGDLDQFRSELLKDIKNLLTLKHTIHEKRWLKSHEVRKILNISPGTLQHLRDTCRLPFSKVGGIIYYEYETIKSMMETSH
jgi:hypothetical protein